MKDLLFNEDIEVIKELQTKQIGTESLKHLFSRINRNPRFKQTEKEYLKKILIDNINNAFRKQTNI